MLTAWLARRWQCLMLPAALALIALLGLSLRLPNLDAITGNYDEGVYLESLLLMHHGYRPFADIIATQGPLHLYLAYLSYAIGGYTLSAARMGSVTASLLALGGVAWAGCALGGRVAAVGAALALALSPTFLQVSRAGLPEAPAVALATLAVASAAWARRTGSDGWRLLAGVLFGLGCLVKPVVLPAAIPVFALSFTGRSSRSILLTPLVTALLGLGALMALGAADVFIQVIGWRLAGHQVDSGGVWNNVSLLVDKLFHQEQSAFYALAVVGAALFVRRAPLAGLVVVLWLAVQLVMLLAYANLEAHLAATLLPPLALLLGNGIAAGRLLVVPRQRAVGVLAGLVGVWYVVSLPTVIAINQSLIAARLSTDRDGSEDEQAAVRLIAEQTAEDEFVITDSPYLAFLANRMVPPRLVDPSRARIRAGALKDRDLVSGLRVYDPKLVVLWTGKLAQFPQFMGAVATDFVAEADFGTVNREFPRGIYHRRERDEGTAEVGLGSS